MAPVISGDRKQLTLQFDGGLVERFRHVRDVVAQGVYKRGLGRVAASLDMAPGNLSVALSDDTTRKFGVDELETYIQKTGDLTPVYYLVERYLGDQAAARDQMLNDLFEMVQDLPAKMAAAGFSVKGRR